MINGQFQFRRDSAANWTAANPTLASGELGLETDTARFKIGNGTTPWNSLAYGGIKGDTGAAGRGIVSITRTAGNGAAGTTDTYTITYNDSTTSTFTVTNGANGVNGQSVAVSDEGTQLTATASSINFTGTGVTATNSGNAVTVNIPGNPAAATAAPPAVATAGAVGTSADYARADHTHQGVTSLSFNGGTATSGAVSITESAAFATVAVSGQSNVVANDRNGTLNIAGSGSVTVTTDAATDTVTISGAVAAPQNCFANVSVGTTPTPTVLASDLAADVLTINAGTGISLTADAVTDTLSIVNADTGSAARAAHEAAADPHPQYTTTAEAAAAAPVQSVAGRTGAVTFLVSTRATEFLSAANNATVQVAHSLVIPAARITAGFTVEFEMWGTQTNVATTGGNNNVLLIVNGTTIATATVAVGTTAQTNRAWHSRGALTFRSATQVVGSIEQMITGVLATIGTNAAAPTTITAGDPTISLAVQTATANAGNTIRVAIAEIKES